MNRKIQTLIWLFKVEEDKIRNKNELELNDESKNE